VECVELVRRQAWQGGGCLLESKGPMARMGRRLCLRSSGKCWKQRGDVVLLADYQVL